MNIALLDDLMSDAEYLNNLIQQCAYENNISLKTSIYTDVSEFFKDIEKYDFSAVFIDILMPGTNGIDLARKIREINKSVPIIFVTTEKSFALEGYDVHAFDYIIKPAPPSRITDILKRLNDTVNEYTITINKNHTVMFIYTQILPHIRCICRLKTLLIFCLTIRAFLYTAGEPLSTLKM